MKLFTLKFYSARLLSMAAITALLSGCDGLGLQDANSRLTTDATSAKIKNPPTPTLSPKEMLGKQIFHDLNLSEPAGFQSCASCHAASQGFAGFGDVTPGGFPRGFVAGFAEGAVSGRFGGRKAPSAAYSTFSPVLSYKKGNGQELEFFGGLFWDGRASGLRLNNPAAEQALGPFLNPVEQNHPTAAAVLQKIKNNSSYGTLWLSAWGASISTATQSEINANYDRVGQSIAAYEASKEVNPFSSKYDAYVAGKATLTAQELQGLNLFSDLNKGECVACHTIKNNNGPTLFTDHGFDNIGLPASSSEFAKKPDYGLRDFLLTLSPSDPWYALADQNAGKFRTPTLRNVAKGTNRRYMHNGIFTSLEQVVHFYNTRDVPGEGWNGTPWGPPEVAATMKRGEVGDLKLTPTEEAAIVAFLKTLNDGWVAN